MIRVRSATRGRQRWDVPAIYRQEALARRLEAALSRRPGILEARANAVTGRVLIRYEGRQPLAADSIRDTLQECMAGPLDHAVPITGSKALATILDSAIADRRRLLVPLLLSALGTALDLMRGLSFVATVDAARAGGPEFRTRRGNRRRDSRFGSLAALSLFLVAANLWVQTRRKKAWRTLAHDIEQKLRSQLFEHIQSQDMEFFDHRGTGRLIHLVVNDTRQIGSFVSRLGNHLVEKSMIVIVTGTTLVLTSPLLALLVCLVVPLFFLPPFLLRRQVAESYSRMGEGAGRFGQMLENSLSGIVDIKSFTAEEHEAEKIKESSELQARLQIEAESLSTRQSKLMDGLVYIGLNSAAAFAGMLAASGTIRQSQYTSALFLIPKLLKVPDDLESTLQSYHRAKSSAKRVLEVARSTPGIRSGPVRKSQVQGEVVFENVSFSYRPSLPVLSDISFEFRPGETVAIVGPTGSGKSTLLRLLLRFYDVDAGRILLDGIDVREFDLRDLRRSVSLVAQDVYLFEGSIRDNVLYGRFGATDPEIRRTLERADALTLVDSLPEGLETGIGPRGKKLSGGQRQRVAIARALLKPAPILALDEAMSNLDYETEAAIQSSLRSAASGQSIVVIAHRLASIRHADRIVVLEQGRIREQGTHQQLLNAGGLYSSLWQLQSGEAPFGAELEVRLSRSQERSERTS